MDVVRNGGRYLRSSTLKKVVKRQVKGAASGYKRLSDHEREVLKLLADGLTLEEIAARWWLASRTVDAHRTNMMRKLDFHDGSEVIKYAIQHS